MSHQGGSFPQPQWKFSLHEETWCEFNDLNEQESLEITLVFDEVFITRDQNERIFIICPFTVLDDWIKKRFQCWENLDIAIKSLLMECKRRKEAEKTFLHSANYKFIFERLDKGRKKRLPNSHGSSFIRNIPAMNFSAIFHNFPTKFLTRKV